MKLGWFIRVRAPLEYDLIMQVVGPNGVPSPDLVEAISYSSTNPFFRTEKFRKLLILYRNEGCFALRPMKPPTPKQIRKYSERRKTMLKR